MNKILSLLLSLIIIVCYLLLPSYAHSGRTDSSGGHRDNRNKSGLGSYHYHHGFGPHLHPNGICPYSIEDEIVLDDMPLEIDVVNSIVVDNMPSEMNVGDSLALSWTTSENSSVIWSSSDEKILSASNGILTAFSPGIAVITATMIDGTKDFIITVKNVFVDKITIDNKITSLEIGESYILNCNIGPSNATDKSVTWNSSNDNIIAVEDGHITALSEGKATITATSANGLLDKFELEVIAIHPENIIASVKEVKLNKGKQMTIEAYVEPSDASYSDIIWSSEDEKVALVNEGIITGSSIGKTNIVLQCDDVSLIIPVEICEFIAMDSVFVTNDMKPAVISKSIEPNITSNEKSNIINNNLDYNKLLRNVLCIGVVLAIIIFVIIIQKARINNKRLLIKRCRDIIIKYNNFISNIDCTKLINYNIIKRYKVIIKQQNNGFIKQNNVIDYFKTAIKIILNDTYSLLTTGECHINAGILSNEGEAYYIMYKYLLKICLHKNYISKVEYSDTMNELERSIKSVG